jgi:hypothetical protein
VLYLPLYNLKIFFSGKKLIYVKKDECDWYKIIAMGVFSTEETA